MGQTRAEPQEPPTIWALPDDVWPLIQTLLAEHSPATRQGPRRVDLRRVLHGLICRGRPGCPWHHLPAGGGEASTGHRPCQPWGQRGLWARLWAVLVEPWEAVGGVDWPWQAADAAMGRARPGGDLVGRHPTARGQTGGTAAWWGQPRAGHWEEPWLEPTVRPPHGWRRRARPSSSSGQRQRSSGRNRAGWRRGMPIPPAMTPSPPPRLCRLCGVWARTRSIRRDSTPPLLADGWSHARGHGGQHVVASWCARSRKPSMSWVCSNWPVP